jgi:hypothetical protein
VRQWPQTKDVSTETEDMNMIRFQVMASENVEDLACMVVRITVCELVRAL